MSRTYTPVNHGDTCYCGNRVFVLVSEGNEPYWSHWATEETEGAAQCLARSLKAWNTMYHGRAEHEGTGTQDGYAVNYYRAAGHQFALPVEHDASGEA